MLYFQQTTYRIFNMKTYSTIFFDLDGTLTESAEGIINCVIYALKALEQPIPHSDILFKFIGPPLIDSFMNYTGSKRL